MKAEDVLMGLVQNLVDDPQCVRIETHISDHSATFNIIVPDAEVGKVLGKKGVYAKAMRLLFGAIYGKHKMGLHLQVVDPRR